MRFSEILKIVFTNIVQNKIKVILTSLGIIAGTVTIVMVLAIGRGGEEEVLAQFSGLSAETIYVNPDYSRGSTGSSKEIPHLTIDCVEQIREESTAISNLYIRANAYRDSVVSGQKENLPIAGVTDGYEEVSNLNVSCGESISEIDIDNESNVAVIGDSVAKKFFFSSEDAIGMPIKIGNRTYTIIGVLERRGDGMQGINPDDTVFIPFTTAQKYVFDGDTMPQIVALAESLSSVETAKAEIKSTLDYVLDDGSVYMIEDTGSRMDSATKSARTMNMLLISVSSIVFLVSGIGIMNVLFLSVKERTKEIGILKALGSPKSEIMIQFLLESITISALGGIVGVVLGGWLMPLMEYTDIPISPTFSGKLIALAFALFTGTVFGLYPAYKASQLKPIEALNYE